MAFKWSIVPRSVCLTPCAPPLRFGCGVCKRLECVKPFWEFFEVGAGVPLFFVKIIDPSRRRNRIVKHPEPEKCKNAIKNVKNANVTPPIGLPISVTLRSMKLVCGLMATAHQHFVRTVNEHQNMSSCHCKKLHKERGMYRNGQVISGFPGYETTRRQTDTGPLQPR